MNESQQVLVELKRLHSRLDGLESLLTRSIGKRPGDRSIMAWSEVARGLGIEGKSPAAAARARIRRAINKANGPSIRVYRSGVHRGDFERWLAESARDGAGEIVRRALGGGR